MAEVEENCFLELILQLSLGDPPWNSVSLACGLEEAAGPAGASLLQRDCPSVLPEGFGGIPRLQGGLHHGSVRDQAPDGCRHPRPHTTGEGVSFLVCDWGGGAGDCAILLL